MKSPCIYVLLSSMLISITGFCETTHRAPQSASLNMGLSLSAIAGSRTLLGIRDGITGIENISAERFSLPIADGWRMALRATSMIALELPIDYLMMTIQHEFFGHGARCIEFGGMPAYIYTTPPWPYGKGHASVACVNAKLTAMERHVLNVGGVTGGDVMRDDLAYSWISRQAISGPSTWLYPLSAVQTTGYLWVGSFVLQAADPTRTDLGDMTTYVEMLNRFYQRDDALSIKSLKLLSLVNLLDPLLYYSFYAMYHYVRYGQDAPMWMIPFGDSVKYLPTAKMSFTPFGPDISLANYFLIHNHAMVATLRAGLLEKRSYFGVGVIGEAFRNSWLSLGGHVEVFRQPEILQEAQFHYKNEGTKNAEFDHADPGFGSDKFGFLATITSSFRPFDAWSIEVEIGGKTKGYVPGEIIGGGLLLRGGMTIYF